MFKFIQGAIFDIILVITIWFGLLFLSEFNLKFYLGTFLTFVGIAFWLLARYQLGRAFSVLPKATAIVNRGLYSKIRHPIYFISSIAILGLCIIYHKPWAYLALFLLVCLQIFRAKKEEKILAEKFGQEYLNYKKSTWF